eukprot:m.32064 g.32064  ORF g.32064 m.32064 type:complete len:257 (-) comp9362_c0_seq1:1772-2542(-)
MAAAQASGAADQLEFGEFKEEPIHHPESSPPKQNEATEQLLPPPTGQTTPSGPSFSSLEYYQQFFDVDTEQVVSRITSACWPFRDDFLTRIKDRSDLYGPFWISTTLVFVLAMAGNIVEFRMLEDTARGEWRYDFSKVTLAATTIYTYVNMVPLLLWAYMRWKLGSGPSLLEIVCIYGYAMFVYIPVAFVCILSSSAMMRLVFIVVALGLSGGSLVANFARTLSGSAAANRTLLLSLVALAHGAVALGFQMYFFQY